MKKLLLCLSAGAALVAFADLSVVSYSAKQRWPWSPVVDIDLICGGSGSGDISLSATYAGSGGSIDLLPGVVEGDMVAKPGLKHLVWSPAAAGLGATALSGFSVMAGISSVDSHKYLTLDLKDGTCQFHASEPAGGWNQNVYKTRYIVFRRVPAGTYQLGYTAEQFAALRGLKMQSNDATKDADIVSARTVTISTDYYIGIFMLTEAQRANIAAFSDSNTGKKVTKVSLLSWRGAFTNAAEHATWPTDGHGVSSSSVIASIRNRFVGRLPGGMVIDLPTEAQWEVAARSGTSTFFDGCGDDVDAATIQAYKEEHSPYQDAEVGTAAANTWGLYDTAGISYEMVLNRALVPSGTTTRTYYDWPTFKVDGEILDPVGLSDSALDGTCWALACNCGWSGRSFAFSAVPPSRRAYAPEPAQTCAARLCIHLKPLVK